MTLRRTIADCLAALAAGMLFAAALAARPQQSQGPIAPKPGTPVQQPPEGTIRVRVALVTAPVGGIHGKGEPVVARQQKDFHILGGRKDQTIEGCGVGGEKLSAVLVYETSSR